MQNTYQLFDAISNKGVSTQNIHEVLFSLLKGDKFEKNDFIESYLHKILNQKGNLDITNLFQLIGLSHQRHKEKQLISNTNERKHYGIYYTDYRIAKRIVDETLSTITDFKKFFELTFLEPCVGNGVFVIAYIDHIFEKVGTKLSDKVAQKLIDNIYCADIDSEAVILLKRFLPLFLYKKYHKTVTIKKTNFFMGDLLFEIRNNHIIRKNDPKIIFNIASGFDVIVTNPPYRLLKANSDKYDSKSAKNITKEIENLVKFIKDNGCYKFNEGTLNYYKLFVEEIVENYSHNSSKIGLLIPLTILNDKQSEKLRKRILGNYKLSKIYIIPEKNDFFIDVSQAFCFFSIDKALKGESFFVNPCVINEKDFDDKEIKVDLESIKGVSQSWPVIVENQSGWDILKKIHKHPSLGSLTFIHNLRGELDLTLDKKFITNEKTQHPLLRGANIKEFGYQTGTEFVRHDFIKKIPNKNHFIKTNRIICQQISNIHSDKRLKFTIIPSGFILGNSCNFIARENSLFDQEQVTLQYLVGILNSLLIDWRFKITSSNNHISNYELDELPIAIPSVNQRKTIENLVDNVIKNHHIDTIVNLNIEVFNLYGLNDEKIRYILAKYSQCELIERIKNVI